MAAEGSAEAVESAHPPALPAPTEAAPSEAAPAQAAPEVEVDTVLYGALPEDFLVLSERVAVPLPQRHRPPPSVQHNAYYASSAQYPSGLGTAVAGHVDGTVTADTPRQGFLRVTTMQVRTEGGFDNENRRGEKGTLKKEAVAVAEGDGW